jgi:hypothetical protein
MGLYTISPQFSQIPRIFLDNSSSLSIILQVHSAALCQQKPPRREKEQAELSRNIPQIERGGHEMGFFTEPIEERNTTV